LIRIQIPIDKNGETMIGSLFVIFVLQFSGQEAAPSLSPTGLRVLHGEGVRIMQSLHQTEKQTAMRGKVSISPSQSIA
jgi:hypothetical protein